MFKRKLYKIFIYTYFKVSVKMWDQCSGSASTAKTLLDHLFCWMFAKSITLRLWVLWHTLSTLWCHILYVCSHRDHRRTARAWWHTGWRLQGANVAGGGRGPSFRPFTVHHRPQDWRRKHLCSFHYSNVKAGHHKRITRIITTKHQVDKGKTEPVCLDKDSPAVCSRPQSRSDWQNHWRPLEGKYPENKELD